MLTPSVKRMPPALHQLSVEARPEVSDDAKQLSPSAAIPEPAPLTPSPKKMHPLSTSVHQHSICQCHPADAFLYLANEKFAEPILLVIPPDPLSLGPPLISLGPNTDAILDRFSLGDDLLPRLHTLVRKVHSSRWEAVLRAAPWDLTYEQAFNLSNALAADLKGTPGFSISTVCFPFTPVGL
jgi:hypothetical protein